MRYGLCPQETDFIDLEVGTPMNMGIIYERDGKNVDQFHAFLNWRKCMKTTNLWLEKGEFFPLFPRRGSKEGVLPSLDEQPEWEMFR